MLDDMVELSNSASAVKANAAVFRTASGLSLDVVNLGRRIDIRA